VDQLADDLLEDAETLVGILQQCGQWDPVEDEKLKVLHDLIQHKHPDEKVLVFTQFADTVEYLTRELIALGVEEVAGVSGAHSNPAEVAWKFSPESNGKRRSVTPEDELRVVITTDVLSEGHNLQDCAIVVNF